MAFESNDNAQRDGAKREKQAKKLERPKSAPPCDRRSGKSITEGHNEQN
jgi:hypothetical protein